MSMYIRLRTFGLFPWDTLSKRTSGPKDMHVNPDCPRRKLIKMENDQRIWEGQHPTLTSKRHHQSSRSLPSRLANTISVSICSSLTTHHSGHFSYLFWPWVVFLLLFMVEWCFLGIFKDRMSFSPFLNNPLGQRWIRVGGGGRDVHTQKEMGAPWPQQQPGLGGRRLREAALTSTKANFSSLV